MLERKLSWFPTDKNYSKLEVYYGFIQISNCNAIEISKALKKYM